MKSKSAGSGPSAGISLALIPATVTQEGNDSMKEKNLIQQIGNRFLIALFCLVAFAGNVAAQADSLTGSGNYRPAEMATTMRSNGKIYVVVAVLLIILAGLFFYLIRLDRKISRLEKDASTHAPSTGQGKA